MDWCQSIIESNLQSMKFHAHEESRSSWQGAVNYDLPQMGGDTKRKIYIQEEA